MNVRRPRRPRLAFPFTLLSTADTVRLVAGEDFRYTVNSPSVERWLPDLVARFDGRTTVDELLTTLPAELKTHAAELVDRFYAERIVFDGTVEQAHNAAVLRVVPEGTGSLVQRLQFERDCQNAATHCRDIHVLCQDRLDYHAVLDFNRRMLSGNSPWMWVTYGALSRGYVSPLFLPDAGPCLGCLIQQFQRLSPFPEVYDELANHARAGKPIAPSSFPEPGLEILRQIVMWKLSVAASSEPPAGLFRLYAVEADSLEVSVHRVFRAPRCPQCAIFR